jgi:hypothetical protein
MNICHSCEFHQIPLTLPLKSFSPATRMESIDIASEGPVPPPTCIDRFPSLRCALFFVAALTLSFGIFFPIYRLFLAGPSPSPFPFFLYVNDIHLDPLYRPLSRSADHSLCRTDTAVPSAAYPFGQYGCDSPPRLFNSLLEFLPTVAGSPDFVLFGGDATAHRTGVNRSEVQNVFRNVIEGLAAVWPSVPVLVTIGNNDLVPNYGSFENDSLDFESMAAVMRAFLSEGQMGTFLKGGYYSQDFHARRLRLLLLNTCVYSTVRGYSTVDPYDQFQWIRDEAAEARLKGYGVGIAMHIPPGVSYIDLTQGWMEEYVRKFDEICKENDILFTLAGHTHYDMLMPVYAPGGQSKGYSLSSPSISPQHSNNPGFRVISYDDTGIRNIRQYYADILMNPQQTLDWELEYDFAEGYSVQNLSTESLMKVVEWITTTGKGKWAYKERVCARASDNGAFYYCILKATTAQQIRECMAGLQGKSLASMVPYGGDI